MLESCSGGLVSSRFFLNDELKGEKNIFKLCCLALIVQMIGDS